MCAAAVGDLEYTKYLLEAGGDVHVDDDAALVRACYNGHLDVVQYLISKGADVNAHNYLSLKGACSGGFVEIVRLLLAEGAHVASTPTWQQEKFVYRAVKGGSVKILQMIIDNGIEIARDLFWALPDAAQWGHMDILRFLLACDGAQPTSLLRDCIHKAYLCRRIKVASFLFEKFRPEGNADDLYYACFYGHILNAGRLLGDGVIDEGRALKAAIDRGHVAIVKQLLSYNFMSYAYVDCSRSLERAWENNFSGVVEEYMQYLKKESVVGGYEGYCHSGLERAVYNGHTSTIAVLLKHGLDPNFKSGLLLYIASHRGRDNILWLLLGHGAKLTTRWGLWAVVRASESGYLNCMQILLQAGAERHSGHVIMAEALRLAVASGEPEVVEILLERGVDISTVLDDLRGGATAHLRGPGECKGWVLEHCRRLRRSLDEEFDLAEEAVMLKVWGEEQDSREWEDISLY
ncbi:hypothetical protein HK097_007493 [Rhizophlyctis rosea]|uniref:Uncharacterized protein n=1 Tax=Rhizophlyctis rosea TaxID=64517 RepID=A0AAD5X9H6_9FUNG|nr:hypothetical protein HK097_007493 [Rhizophlyctis rosea]